MEKFKSNTHLTRVPTLLIGIGGIGSQILSNIDSMINDYDRKYVSLLELDTDVEAIIDMGKRGVPYIQTSRDMTVSQYLNQYPEFTNWFQDNYLLNAKSLTSGAGQVRSISRLGALASESAGLFDDIESAARKIQPNDGSNIITNLRVMIVGSITGGTGSGLALQLPFLVRHILKKPDLLVRGLFLTPDITEDVQDDVFKKAAVHVNTYAFLRELNGFYLAADPKVETKLDIEHYDRGKNNIGKAAKSSEQIPYQLLFLLEGDNSNNRNEGAFDTYIYKAAQIVKNQLFSPYASSSKSSEDNLIISNVEQRGMNRYCGAGISTVVYPVDDVRRYCSLRFSDKIISDSWLYFDNKFRADLEVNNISKLHDHKIKDLDHAEWFINEVNSLEKSPDTSVDLLMPFDSLYRFDVDPVTQKQRHEKVNICKDICKSIERFVGDTFDKSISEYRDKCEINNAFAKNFKHDALLKNAKTLINAFQIFADKAKEMSSTLVPTCMNKILPTDRKIILSDNEQIQYSIYGNLKKLHPLAARYMLFYLLDYSKKRSSELEGISTVPDEDITKKDWSPKEKGTQSFTHVFAKYSKNKKEYTKLLHTFSSEYESDVDAIYLACKNKLLFFVFDDLKRKLTLFSEVFNDLFDSMSNIILRNRSEIQSLEKGYPETESGVLYVCQNTLCKNELFDDYCSNIQYSDNELGKNVFPECEDLIYDQFIGKYKNKYEKKNIEILSNSQIVENGIISNILKLVVEKGDSIINMSIFEAIEKQLRIYQKNNYSDQWCNDYNMTYKDSINYLRQILLEAKNVAVPFISYENNDMVKFSYTWGINNSAISMYFGVQDNQGALKSRVGTVFELDKNATYNKIIDDSYSPYEIVCCGSVYGLLIQQLTKYKKGSTTYEYYMKRINEVINNSFVTNDGENGYLDSVHPHLDYHWHNTEYLPMIEETDNDEILTSSYLSFLVSSIKNMCHYSTIDYQDCWSYLMYDSDSCDYVPIYVDGKIVGSRSYFTLYDCLRNNTPIVKDILKRCQKIEDNVINNYKRKGFTIENSTSNLIIKSFIGTEKNVTINNLEELFSEFKPGEPRDEDYSDNILDIIFSVFTETGDKNLLKGLIKQLSDYIYELCMKITNNQPGFSKVVSEYIMKEIGKNSLALPFVKKGTDTTFENFAKDYLS